MPDHSHANRRRPVSIPIILIAAAALVIFLILNGHGYHLLSLAPLLILLACPLMHMFGHHGHGSHGRGQPVAPQSTPADIGGNR